MINMDFDKLRLHTYMAYQEDCIYEKLTAVSWQTWKSVVYELMATRNLSGENACIEAHPVIFRRFHN